MGAVLLSKRGYVVEKDTLHVNLIEAKMYTLQRRATSTTVRL